MPERHSEGGGGGSSSGSSSSSSSSHSSWSSGSSYHSYNSGPQTPEQRAFSMAVGIIMLIVLGIIFLANSMNSANQKRQNTDATQTTIAITIADLKEMNAALKDRIPVWKQQTTDRNVHRVSAAEAGFGPASNTKEVDYGFCATDKFYVYVLESSHPGGFMADTEGYVYSPDIYPTSCVPFGWQTVSIDNAGTGWYFITLSTYEATRTNGATWTPWPTTLPPTPTPGPNPDF